MRVSNRNTPSRIRGQSGQGTVELLLILVVTVGLILGGVYQLNDAFRIWANNYFGNYLSCLLETGELPAIGGTGGTKASCNDQFESFSLAKGRPLKESGGSQSGRSEDGPKEKGAPASEGGSSAAYSRVNRGGGSGASAGNRLGQDADLAQRGRRSGGVPQKKAYTGSTESSVPPGVSSSQTEAQLRREGRLLPGFWVTRNEPLPEERQTRLTTSQGEPSSQKSTRFKVERKPARQEAHVEDRPLSFGDYFRYILIAIILILVVIVLGGQLLQISKELK